MAHATPFSSIQANGQTVIAKPSLASVSAKARAASYRKYMNNTPKLGVSSTSAALASSYATARWRSRSVATLSVNTASLAFGSLNVNTASTQSITLSSTGTASVTVNSATIKGTGFSVSGLTLPATLTPGQTATLKVQFKPTAAGAISGSLTIASTSSTNSSAVVSLSGTGTAAAPAAALSSLSCGSTSMTGAGSDSCTVALTAAAPSSGMAVALSSNNSSVAVPSSVTVPANATSAAFKATVSSVTSAQTVTVTASASSVSKTVSLKLNPPAATVATLSINATTVAFGSVSVNSAATQSVTLSSTGTASVTVNSAAVKGTGFTLAGSTLPVTLAPGQSATLNVQFDPTAAGALTGQLTVVSTSSTNGTATINLTGTGVAATQAQGKTYYLAANGSDSNNGLSSSAPWLTPNHSLNCGDVIIAAPSTSYSASNFYTGKWGTVNCPAGNNVAWLTCATFDACKISTSSNQGMWVDKSYWGVQGWEITTSASDLYGTCFIAQPNWTNPVEIHHIIFANDVANGCSQAGFAVTPNVSSRNGVDYFAVVGSIAYNASEGSGTCASGISIWEPVQSDTQPGTHIYVAGNFSYGNLEPSECAGTSPTDGEGIIFDTFDGTQSGFTTPYAAQAVAYNNIVVNNGGKGVEVYNNAAGSAHSTIYLNNNTSWGNLTDPNQSWLGCGEIIVNVASDTHVYGNLVSTKSATGCGGNPIYALSIGDGDSTDSMESNFAYGYNGNNTFLYASGSFSYASSNTFNTNPSFKNPTAPAAPNCGSYPNAPACMATVIANFRPTNAAAQTYGYQTPLTTPVADPLFPQWLCNVNLPSGLVTMGCQN